MEVVKGRVQIAKKLKKNIFRRQDAPKTFDMNASIYIWNRKTLLKSSNSAVDKKTKTKIIFHEMPRERSVDIDDKFDFKLVEFLLKRKKI